jgi:hypothetical protein
MTVTRAIPRVLLALLLAAAAIAASRPSANNPFASAWDVIQRLKKSTPWSIALPTFSLARPTLER